jgi:hypothetical protein
VKLEKSTEIWVEDEKVKVKTNDKTFARSMKKARFKFVKDENSWLFMIPMSELKQEDQ